MPTVYNSGSGEWTAKATWQGGAVPTAADDVFLDFFDPSRPSRSYVVDLNTFAAVHDLMILAKNELSIGATLQLDSLIISDGTLSGYGGGINVSKVVQNNGTIEANTVGGIIFDGPGTLLNMGTLSAVGNGNGNQIGCGLEIVNSGLIEAIDGGEMILSSIKNTGVITASGQGSIIQTGGTVLNAGTIQSVDGAIFMLSDTTNGKGGAVIVDGGGLQINGVIDGGTVTILNNGSFFSVPFAGGEHSTASVLFAGPGLFGLNPSGYDGTIEGFDVGAQIDVGDVAYVAGKNKFDPNTGFLTIADGHHTTTLHLDGVYTADDFLFRPDENGTGTLVSFNRQGSTAPHTIDQADLQIASLYLGYFGRAGDPEGKDYWHDHLGASPASLAAIAASFAVQAEAKAAYPLLADPQHATPAGIASFIDQVYENLFGRDPDAAGAAYWQNQLATSVATAGVGAFVLNVISGAQAGDAATIAHRAEVAAFFSDHLAIVQLAYDATADLLARNAIDGVTSDDATVVAAKMAMSTFIDDQQLVKFTGIVTG
jgi:hypothetical protein